MTAGGNSFRNATAHKVNSYYTLAISYCTFCVGKHTILGPDYYFYTPGSEGSQGLKSIAGMAVGPGNRCRMSCTKSTELKRWIVTEMRWNKNWASLSSPERWLIFSLTDEIQCWSTDRSQVLIIIMIIIIRWFDVTEIINIISTTTSGLNMSTFG